MLYIFNIIIKTIMVIIIIIINSIISNINNLIIFLLHTHFPSSLTINARTLSECPVNFKTCLPNLVSQILTIYQKIKQK